MQPEAGITSVAPVLKPGVGSSYSNGWTQLWKHFGVLLLIGLIVVVLSAPFSIVQWVVKGYNPIDLFTLGLASMFGFLGFLYSIFISNPINYGVSFAYLKTARGDKVEVGDMFAAFKNYWNAVGVNVLVGIIVAVGFIFLIVPGICLACKLAFVPYLVVDRKMGVTAAINESWNMTRGHAWKVFLIGLLAIPIVIAGFIVFVIGVIPAIMWISTAFASLYHAVSKQREAEKPAEVPANS